MPTHATACIISSARTALRSFQGMRGTVPAPHRGATVIQEAIRRAKLPG